MSFRPRWADAILSGGKTVELRRRRSGCQPGTPIVIYASHPVMEIQGVCEVAGVVAGTPGEVWGATRGRNGVTRAESDDYLTRCETAYGIVVHRVRHLEAPVALGHRGPRSFRYLRTDDPQDARLLRAVGLAG